MTIKPSCFVTFCLATLFLLSACGDNTPSHKTTQEEKTEVKEKPAAIKKTEEANKMVEEAATTQRRETEEQK